MAKELPEMRSCGVDLVWVKTDRGDVWSTVCPRCGGFGLFQHRPAAFARTPTTKENLEGLIRPSSKIWRIVEYGWRRLAYRDGVLDHHLRSLRLAGRSGAKRRPKRGKMGASEKYITVTLYMMDKVDAWMNDPGELARLLSVRLPKMVDYEETSRLHMLGEISEEFVLKDGSRFVFSDRGWVHTKPAEPQHRMKTKSSCP